MLRDQELAEQRRIDEQFLREVVLRELEREQRSVPGDGLTSKQSIWRRKCKDLGSSKSLPSFKLEVQSCYV